MQKKAIIFDLDNTIYLVSSIGDRLFQSLFSIITESGEYSGDLDKMKAEIMRRPFQYIAEEFEFSEKLKSACLDHLKHLTFDSTINPVENYETIRDFSCLKFLVTTGFTTLQNSKIEQLGIENDFEKIFIIDPSETAKTKRDIFKKILIDYELKLDEVLVVGDDLNSEIKSAKELGIESVLYDFKSVYSNTENPKVIRNFSELNQYI
jgi:putative hydrolase of the HAD superfamily